jgi:hypothetical protein
MFAATSPLKLTPNSTLADLPSHNFRVTASTPTQVVETKFLESPELPGVIVTQEDSGVVVGVMSRPKFLEQMSQEYSRDIYLRRPVQVFLSIVDYEPLEIPEQTSIDAAVNLALNRPPEYLYEPIVVIQEDGELRMLELNQLILAQSQIFAQVNALIRTQKEWARKYAEGLKKEQRKVKEYTQKLEAEEQEARLRHQMLEAQQYQLEQQTQQISQLNQRFIQIGQLLSTEGKKTFQEMLTSVKAICGSTQEVIEVEQAFTKELMALNDALRLIERVSQQVRRLSVQASVLSRHSESSQGEGQLSGLRLITTEIDSLGNKTLEATTQINQIANQFKFQIEQLTNASRGSEEIARSLVDRTQKTQDAIAQLEELIGSDNQLQSLPTNFV